MIAHLSGTILKSFDRLIILEVNSVGYEIFVPYPFAEHSEGSSLQLVIYTHTTDQGTSLFGFKTWEEKLWFKTLMSVSGIGPKAALSILASASLDEVLSALQKNDADFFTSIPGIGKKTANRIIVELRDTIPSSDTQSETELNDALITLGYQKKEFRPLLRNIDPTKSLEEQISTILKQLSGV